MIQVYKSSNINYDFNGDVELLDVVNASLHMELNGVASIEVTVEYDKEGRWSYLTADNVIKADVNYTKNPQLFRIYDVIKNEKNITAYANHIFFDLTGVYAKDLNNNEDVMIIDTGNATGQQAINKIFNGTKFNANSNIGDIYRSRYVRRNIIDILLGDDENSFCKRWNGEIYLDNYNVTIDHKIGNDNGVSILYGKNLVGIEENFDITTVVTRIIPVGFDGIHLNGKTPWVDSSLIDRYTEIKEMTMIFDDVKVKDDSTSTEGFETIEEAREELIRRSKSLYTEEHIDEPKVTINISMEDISTTKEYRDYFLLESVGLGDYVLAEHSLIGIKTTTRVIAVDWDILTKKYINVTLGNVEYNYFNNQTNAANRVNNIITSNGKLDGTTLEGIIDCTNAKLKCLRTVAERQNIRAMLFEDNVEESETYGCCVIGSCGLEIANAKKPDGSWNFRTAITGKSIIADEIVSGTLSTILIKSLDGKNFFDLSTGEIHLEKGYIGNNTTGYDITSQTILGDNLKIDLSKGIIDIGSNGGYIGSADRTCYWNLTNQKIVGKNIILDLLNGNINLSGTGKIGSNSCYFDIENQKIVGNGLNIDLIKGTLIKTLSDNNYLVMSDDGKFYNSGTSQNYVCAYDTYTRSDIITFNFSGSGANMYFGQKRITIEVPLGEKFNGKSPRYSYNIAVFGAVTRMFDQISYRNLSSNIANNTITITFDLVYEASEVNSDGFIHVNTNIDSRSAGYSIIINAVG